MSKDQSRYHLKTDSNCLLLQALPLELHLCILTFLRATDLSAVQQTCRFFNNRELIHNVVEHTSRFVYPPELTQGFDTPVIGGSLYALKTPCDQFDIADTKQSKIYHSYEAMRNMEMLVVARVLNRPEPALSEREGCFYVSKSWCRAALRWLEVQQEERENKMKQYLVESRCHVGKKGRKKEEKRLSKKEQRIRQRRFSEVMPPWPNVNSDIICEHGDLKHCSSKQARARRRIMDKKAWKVLKRLYPESVQLCGLSSGCLHCIMESETQKKNEADLKEKQKIERRKPLSCPIVRNIYTRHGGVPKHCLIQSNTDIDVKASTIVSDGKVIKKEIDDKCPLIPGIYHALPRAWCHRWRKYLKNGDGERPAAPDASALLCSAHKLPLIPPHLEAFLYGDSPTLLGHRSDSVATEDNELHNDDDNDDTIASVHIPVGFHPIEDNKEENLSVSEVLRAAGMCEAEVQAQRLAMLAIERQTQNYCCNVARMPVTQSPPSSTYDKKPSPTITNAQLDRENGVVVEILTDEEFTALLRWWPEIHSSYALSFAITVDSSLCNSRFDISWNTLPCRECDATGKACTNFSIRNRARGWARKV